MIEFIIFVVSIYKGNSLMLSHVKGKKILLETAAFKKRFRCFKEGRYHITTGTREVKGEEESAGQGVQSFSKICCCPSIHPSTCDRAWMYMILYLFIIPMYNNSCNHHHHHHQLNTSTEAIL